MGFSAGECAVVIQRLKVEGRFREVKCSLCLGFCCLSGKYYGRVGFEQRNLDCKDGQRRRIESRGRSKGDDKRMTNKEGGIQE